MDHCARITGFLRFQYLLSATLVVFFFLNGIYRTRELDVSRSMTRNP